MDISLRTPCFMFTLVFTVNVPDFLQRNILMAQNPHDMHYRRLFGNPYMVRSLFEGILLPSLRQQVDLDTLKPLPTHFVSNKSRDRHADCVWQVRRRDGEMLYLLTCWSHRPRACGPISQTCATCCWTKVRSSEKAVCPMKTWLRCSFVWSIIAVLSHQRKWCKRLTKAPELTEVRRAFTLWINHVLLPRHLPELATDFSQAQELSETLAMLTTHRHWGHEFRKEGRQEGRIEGRQEGRQEKAIDTLSMLITHKFGTLPDWARSRLEQAAQEDLNRWTLRVLDAQRIEEVFD